VVLAHLLGPDRGLGIPLEAVLRAPVELNDQVLVDQEVHARTSRDVIEDRLLPRLHAHPLQAQAQQALTGTRRQRADQRRQRSRTGGAGELSRRPGRDLQRLAADQPAAHRGIG
jgi:hypothetical protein